MFSPSTRLIWLLAALLTAFNCLKPLHMDDSFYYAHAAHLAEQPLDPYGFQIFWHNWPEPAIGEVCPPVFPYWLAIGLRFFGTRPWLWKIWLFPIAWLLIWCLRDLLHRFAPGVETPLLVLTVFSPAILPSFNLMVDIPALALGLAAVVLFFRAESENSTVKAVAAGLMAALAMQTKYSACIVPALILVHAILYRRTRLGLIALVTAALVFVGWEFFVLFQDGDSHFLYVAGLRDVIRYPKKPDLLLPLLVTIGSLAPAVALAGWIALGVPRPFIVLGGLAILVGQALIGWRGWQLMVDSLQGVAVWLTIACVLRALIGRAVRPRRPSRAQAHGSTPRAASDDQPNTNLQPIIGDDCFLAVWLILEVGSYFVLSPFPATRRFLGMHVVLTLLVGRLLSQSRAQKRLLLSGVVAVGSFLGVGVYAVDCWEAHVYQHLVTQILAAASGRDPASTIWFGGHWGFQFYAEQAGMRPVVPDHSLLRAGDWLALPFSRIDSQGIGLVQNQVETVAQIAPQDSIPFGAQGYYLGNFPIEAHRGPRTTIKVFRLRQDAVPYSPKPAEYYLRWAASLNRPIPALAIRAVLKALDQVASDQNSDVALAPILQKLTENENAQIRETALQALERLLSSNAVRALGK